MDLHLSPWIVFSGFNSNDHSQGGPPGAVAIYYDHVQQFIEKRVSTVISATCHREADPEKNRTGRRRCEELSADI